MDRYGSSERPHNLKNAPSDNEEECTTQSKEIHSTIEAEQLINVSHN